MSINMPIVRIETQQAGANPVIPSRGYNRKESVNSPSFGVVIKDEGKAFKFMSWLGDDFTSAGQRLISGITALFTQPFFDWHNKNVDEDTRKTSTARTLGKIIAGTLTGVAIRQICIEATKKFTQNENIVKSELDKFNKKAVLKGKPLKDIPKEFNFTKVQQGLLPKSKLGASAREIKKYRGAFGTFAAVGIMVFTNFLIDAPLTTYLTNIFVKKFKHNSNSNEQKPVTGGNK